MSYKIFEFGALPECSRCKDNMALPGTTFSKRIYKKLFSIFDRTLKDSGYLAMSGQIVDATIFSAPRQRMTQEEKEKVKEGEIPEEWKAKPSKLAQKDTDARWVVKYSKAKNKESSKLLDLAAPYFGYKNHLSTDKRYNFIRKFHVTEASRYDGKILSQLLDKENTYSDIWGDTAYRCEENERLLQNNGFVSKPHRKNPKIKLMPIRTLKANSKKSKVGAKVEHVFAKMACFFDSPPQICSKIYVLRGVHLIKLIY